MCGKCVVRRNQVEAGGVSIYFHLVTKDNPFRHVKTCLDSIPFSGVDPCSLSFIPRDVEDLLHE